MAPETMVHYLLQCAVQGLVAIVWMLGLRRFMAPLSPSTWSGLLASALALPPVLWGARLLGAPELEPPRIVRVQAWAEALERSPAWVAVSFWTLLGGTALLFLAQEVGPALRAGRQRSRSARVRDPHLDEVLERAVRRFADRGLARRGHRIEARLVDMDVPMAAVVGLVDPQILVSRGALAALDEEELDNVVTHEVAHLYRGGNLKRLGVWILRALQATSPGALVVFRAFLQAEERACDALAARVTGRPAALASALLKFQNAAAPLDASGLLGKARARVLWRSDVAATRFRVEEVLHGAEQVRTPRLETALALFLLGTLLWAVG